LVGQALLEENPALYVIRIDDLIPLGESDEPEADVFRGHAIGRTWLDRSCAQLLIWGVVLRAGTASTLKLFWTTEADVGATKWGRYHPTPELALPRAFWSDLVEVLKLLIASL